LQDVLGLGGDTNWDCFISHHLPAKVAFDIWIHLHLGKTVAKDSEGISWLLSFAIHATCLKFEFGSLRSAAAYLMNERAPDEKSGWICDSWYLRVGTNDKFPPIPSPFWLCKSSNWWNVLHQDRFKSTLDQLTLITN
jgi:hypothetical protein